MTATADPPQARPVPGPGLVEAMSGVGDVRAELVESDAGWTLTLHLDPAAARALRTRLSGHVVADIDLGSVSASVVPNLVPGEPFAVDRFAVVVAEGAVDALQPEQELRPLPG